MSVVIKREVKLEARTVTLDDLRNFVHAADELGAQGNASVSVHVDHGDQRDPRVVRMSLDAGALLPGK